MNKSKLLVTAIFLCTSVYLSGCSQKERITSTTSETTTIVNSVKESSSNTETDIIEINIPIKMIGDLTQEDLNKKCEEKGYKSITINGDGTVTYLLTRQQHEKMMKDMKEELDAYLVGIVGTEDYLNCTNVTFNDNYTDFEITTKSTELDLAESLSIKSYYRTGEDYNYYNNTPVGNVHVKFINADSRSALFFIMSGVFISPMSYFYLLTVM